MNPPEIRLRVDSGHRSLAGHFPGRPVVPGVVWLERILAEARHRLDLTGAATTWPRVKFLRPVPPDCETVLRLTAIDDGFRFQLTDAEGRAVATGQCRVHDTLD